MNKKQTIVIWTTAILVLICLALFIWVWVSTCSKGGGSVFEDSYHPETGIGWSRSVPCWKYWAMILLFPAAFLLLIGCSLIYILRGKINSAKKN